MDVDNNQQSSDGAARSAAEPRLKEARAVESLARRRAIFKGLGKGGAVLVATVPIHTLAGQTLLTAGGQHQCSVSGMHSGVHSATTGVAECGGYSPEWWGQSKTVSGQVVPQRTWPTLPSSWTFNTKCSAVFTRRTLSGDPTLFQVMKPGSYSSTDEFHWICAWLNALSHSFNFPYSGQQVMDFYNANDLNALDFFKTYMEQHT